MASGVLHHQERLKGVDPRLILVLQMATSKLPFDTLVVEGVRSREQMAINYGKGRTIAECVAKGVAPMRDLRGGSDMMTGK